jgi:hypothetical protein
VGAVAFLADLTGTSGGTAAITRVCIYVAHGSGHHHTNRRKGQQAPDGNGVFSKLGYPALNNQGQSRSLRRYPAPKGAPLTTRASISSMLHWLSNKSSAPARCSTANYADPNFWMGLITAGLTGLNDNGQIAVWSALNGKQAVFMWSNTDAQNGLKLLGAASVGWRGEAGVLYLSGTGRND